MRRKMMNRTSRWIVMGALAVTAGAAAHGGGASGDGEVSLFGYGELHYNGTTRDGGENELDLHRMTIGLSYPVSDRISFTAEIDFEHAAEEIEMEFAYLEFALCDWASLRVGSLLMPVGALNEFHEPTGYYSVERPWVQRYIMPTTWQEAGVGLAGSLPGNLDYRLYVVGGLDATGFSAANGIRGGRGGAGEARAEDLAVVGRLEYRPCAATQFGLSGYFGDAGQGEEELDATTVSIFEADAKLKWNLFELSGMGMLISIDDTEALSAAKTDPETMTTEVIGETILGWNVEAAAHVGRTFLPQGQDIVVFTRYEYINTQEDVAGGLVADPANERTVMAAGIAYYPHHQVAVKLDGELWENEAGEEWEQYNLGVAFEY